MPTNFEALRQDGPERMADFIAKLLVVNIRSTIESNYGVTGNDVMWQRYLKEHRAKLLDFLKQEALDEKAV